jgi:arabinofuranosyltransferase
LRLSEERTPAPCAARGASALVVVAVALAHAWSFVPFIADDALITLRYAERLVDGQGLTWTEGPAVEGYSNLLWLLSCAALHALGVDLIHAAWALGFVSLAVAVISPILAVGRSPSVSLVFGVCGALTLATSAPLAAWASGGLEQVQLAAILAICAVNVVDVARDPTAPRALRLAVLGALLAMSRPDTGLFVLALAAGLLAQDRRAGRAAAALTGGWLCASVLILAFRLAYYGDWVPNTAHVKLAMSWARATDGAGYVGSGLAANAGVIGPAIVACALDRGRLALILAPPAVLWTIYVAFVGGDVFPAWRHFVPVLALGGVAIGAGAGRASSSPLAGLWLTLTLAGACFNGLSSASDVMILRARLERWEWDCASVAQALGEGFARFDPKFAVDTAGCLPYFSKLDAIDMLGLNDRHIATRPPSPGGLLGHDHADGAYVHDLKPDIVAFCGPEGGVRPCFTSDAEFMADSRFNLYRPVRIAGATPFQSVVWIRAEQGPLAVTRTEARIDVPPWLLSGNPETVMRVGPDHRLAPVVGPGRPAGIAKLHVPAGTWTVRAEASQSLPVEVRVAGAVAPIPFVLSADGPVDILVGGDGRVEGLTVSRVSP